MILIVYLAPLKRTAYIWQQDRSRHTSTSIGGRSVLKTLLPEIVSGAGGATDGHVPGSVHLVRRTFYSFPLRLQSVDSLIIKRKLHVGLHTHTANRHKNIC